MGTHRSAVALDALHGPVDDATRWSPPCHPHLFSWVGNGRLYFITARPTQKAANLRRQEWIIAHFGDGDDVLFAEGRARVVTDEAELRLVDTAYQAKYVDPISGARASIFDNPQDQLPRRCRPDRDVDVRNRGRLDGVAIREIATR